MTRASSPTTGSQRCTSLLHASAQIPEPARDVLRFVVRQTQQCQRPLAVLVMDVRDPVQLVRLGDPRSLAWWYGSRSLLDCRAKLASDNDIEELVH